MKKLYAHFDGPVHPSRTVIVHVEDDASVDGLLHQFCAAYARKQGGLRLDAATLRVRTDDGTLLRREGSLAAIANKGDVFIIESAVAPAAADAADAADAAASAAPARAPAPAPAAAAAKPSTRTVLAPDPAVVAEAEALLRQAVEAASSRLLRRCRQLCEQIVALQPPAPIAFTAWRLLAACGKAIDNHQRVVEATERALNLRSKAGAADAVVADLLQSRALALCARGNPKEGASCAQSAMSIARDSSVAASVRFALGQCLEKMGRLGEAEVVYKTTLQAGMHGDCAAALSRLLRQQGQGAAAAQICLSALVSDQSNKRLKEELGSVMADDAVSDSVLRGFVPNEGSASATAFVGTVLKDVAEIDAAIKCYRYALGICPNNASYALNLAHTLEVKLQYAQALQVLLSFLRANRDARVRRLSLGTVLSLLDGADEVLRRAPRPEPPAAPPARVEWHTLPQHPLARVVGAAGELHAAWEEAVASAGVPASWTADAASQPAEALLTSAQGALPADQLDTIALLMTLAKILFLTGHLAPLPALVALIEPARLGAQLHLTTVRNENAYYCCVAQLLATPVPTLGGAVGEAVVEDAAAGVAADAAADATAAEEVYVFGDSHTLPAAWRRVPVDARGDALLRPVLATGVKAWHMRDGCRFYPRANFDCGVASIPTGSTVLFVFCEIDCREGVLAAVERDRCETLAASLAQTADIYVAMLLRLVRKRKLRVIVHPVPPVLPQTRDVVLQFNRALRAAVEAHPGKLRWLGGEEKLVAEAEDGQQQLRSEVVLDGTHMHPGYLQLLQPEVAAAVQWARAQA